MMGSMEHKLKHSRRIKDKKKEKVRSVIAKELITSGKYNQRIVKNKRGKEVLTFHDLVESIQEE